MIVEGEEGVFEKDLLEVSSAGDAEGGHPSHVNGPFFSTSFLIPTTFFFRPRKMQHLM